MASIFAITPSPDRVRLDRDLAGEVSFTVTSTRGPMRARAIVVPQGDARPEWFDLEGPAERTIDGTEQFTVKISVPAGTDPAEYRFLLKVVSEANPDDEFTEGPQVAFEVPATEKKGGFPWWILLVVGGVLLVAGIAVAVILLMGGDPELGETCDEGTCAEGLTCNADSICVGDFGFDECTANADCAEGLSCAIEEGEEAGRCVGGLGYDQCDASAEETGCGPGLVCEDGTCKGGVDFVGCSTGECGAGLFCSDSTCVADPVGESCSVASDCGPGQLCVGLAGGDKVCMRSEGQSCESRFECASLTCQDGSCVNLGLGAACTSNAQCQTGLCRNGTCSGRVLSCGPLRPCPSGRICVNGSCRLIILPDFRIREFRDSLLVSP